MFGWLKSMNAQADVAFRRNRRFFLNASLATSVSLMGCGGGGGSASGTTGTVSTPSAPGTTAVWPDDYVADTSGHIWYVSPTGSDGAAGTQAAPFATLGHAVTVVAAGDTVVLADGTYPEAVSMTRSGESGRYITLRAANPGMAKLVVSGQYSALALIGASWIRVEGLDVQAAKDHGIQTENCHHIQIVGNTCHDCGGGGIAANGSDYLLVESNAVFRNTATNTYQTSGISIYQAHAYDAAAGFHIFIRRNMVYANVQSAAITAVHTEGNGIIIDDAHNTQGGSTAGNYAGATLVENNLIAYNGGSAILAYESDNVTVRHNTVAFNNTDALNTGTWRGELANSQGRNNHWYNNIAVCSTAANPYCNAMLDGVTGSFQNTGTEWIGNLLFDANAPGRQAILVAGASNQYSTAQVLINNPVRLDPKFAQTPVGGNADSFKLAATSPAINAARSNFANTTDYNNRTRDSLPDIGALEA
jgi:serralysin